MQANTKELERSITLLGAVALVVGGVVGAGIFVLIKHIAALAGGTVWIAFLLAMIISLVGVIPLIQLAGVLPRAGGGYYYTSRLLSPFTGVMTSWWIVLGGGASTCVVALTFAEYVRPPLPAAWPPSLVAMLLLGAFYVVYSLGMRFAVSLQILLAAQFVVALVIYAAAGMLHSGLAISFSPPRGAGPFLEAVLLCYSTCMGFQVIAEMGEEVRDARRNIPRALLIGGAVVAALYIAVGTVFVNSMPLDGESLVALQAPLSASAADFLPGPLAAFLGLGAITAGLTSFNAAAIAIPRELFAQARDGVLPPALAKLTERTRVPMRAVALFFLLVMIMLASGQDADFFGYTAAIGILAMTGVICLASLRMITRHPHLQTAAYIRFPAPVLWACTFVTILVSLGFGAVMVVQRPSVILLYALWSIFVALFTWTRLRGMPREAREKLRELPGDAPA